MIDKSGFSDAPPPYQHVLQSSSDSKVNLGHTHDPSQTSRSSQSRRPPKACRKAAAPSRWFPTSIFGLSKTTKQVRSTTQDLLRDLLSKARPSEHEWFSLLSNCAETCEAQGLSFSALLQEPFVEGHLPVYWAILKRSPAPAAVTKTDHTSAAAGNSDPDALVLAILDASLPINATSVADARLACLTVSDNTLFMRLGLRYEALSPRSGTDRVLLGGSDIVDSISVVEARGSGNNVSAAFTVRFSITQFQLRMRVSKQARIEFIARGTFPSIVRVVSYTEYTAYLFFLFFCACTGRLWYLAFSVAGSNSEPSICTSRAGEWLVSLGLVDPSPPTWVDARLSIVDRSLPPSQPPTLNPSAAAYQMTLRAGLPPPPKHPATGKQRDAASFPIKTTGSQLSPGGPTREIVVSLDEYLFGATLQNE